MTDCLCTGFRLDRYEIRRSSARDAAGVEYDATDAAGPVLVREYFPAPLAVRLATGRVAARARAHHRSLAAGLAGFVAGCRALQQVEHPAVVGVRAVFTANGTGYAVFDRPQGETLATRLDDAGTLAEPELIALFAPLADALADVHAAGLLHGAINPDNILIDAGGAPLWRGFAPRPIRSGGARRTFGDRAPAIGGAPVPGYGAPEQYRGAGRGSTEGPWTDVYALGAVLHRCAVGVPPADARCRADDAPAAPAARGGYGRRTLEAIDAALALRVAERPRDVPALRGLLSPTGSREPRSPRRSRSGPRAMLSPGRTRGDAADMPASRPGRGRAGRSAGPPPARPVRVSSRAKRDEATPRRSSWAVPVAAAAAFITLLTWMDTDVLRSAAATQRESAPTVDDGAAAQLRVATPAEASSDAHNPGSGPDYTKR